MKVYEQGGFWVISIEPDGPVFDRLLAVARTRGWIAAAIWGIGTLRDPVIGYYHRAEKRYSRIELIGDWELVACHGTLSTKEGEPLLHLHVVLSDAEGQTRGGHLLEARVGTAGEFVVHPLPHPMVRQFDETIGLYLLK